MKRIGIKQLRFPNGLLLASAGWEVRGRGRCVCVAALWSDDTKRSCWACGLRKSDFFRYANQCYRAALGFEYHSAPSTREAAHYNGVATVFLTEELAPVYRYVTRYISNSFAPTLYIRPPLQLKTGVGCYMCIRIQIDISQSHSVSRKPLSTFQMPFHYV